MRAVMLEVLEAQLSKLRDLVERPGRRSNHAGPRDM